MARRQLPLAVQRNEAATSPAEFDRTTPYADSFIPHRYRISPRTDGGDTTVYLLPTMLWSLWLRVWKQVPGRPSG